MKRLLTLLIVVPIGIVLVIISVANRQDASLRLDPINPDTSAYTITLPFFVFLFAALAVGMVLGSMATWWKQGKFRKQARRNGSELKKVRAELDEHNKQQAKATPTTETGLPILTDRSAA